MDRPSFEEWALGLAAAVATRGDCTRRQIGCVILSTDHDVIGVGYNGAWSGGPSCLAGDCPRGRHYRVRRTHCVPGCDSPRHVNDTDACACGRRWPCPNAVEPGSSYDTGPGICHATHAEQNALARVGQPWLLHGSTVYVTENPCEGCVKQIRSHPRHIDAVVWPGGRIQFP